MLDTHAARRVPSPGEPANRRHTCCWRKDSATEANILAKRAKKPRQAGADAAGTEGLAAQPPAGTPAAPGLVEASARTGQTREDYAPTAGVATSSPERAPRDPAPVPFSTTWTELDMRCATCNIIHYVPVCLFLNVAGSPHLVERLRKGQFNRKRCPMCRRIEPVEHPYTYYDPSRQLAVQVRPAWEWRAGGGEEWYAARLEDFFEQWKDHEVRIDVVFGEEQLIERYLSVVDLHARAT